MAKNKTDWISVSSIIIAVVSSCIAFFTMMQMKKQNEFAYGADLIAYPKYTIMTTTIKDTLKKDGAPLVTLNDTLTNDLPIVFVNTGLGVAKNIEITWDYKSSDITGDIIIDVDTVSTGVEFVENIGMQFDSSYYIVDKRKLSFDFILPSSYEKRESIREFPSGYFSAWVKAFQVLNAEEVELEDRNKRIDLFLKRFARIPFDVTYNDVFNNKQKRKYDMLIYPISVNVRSNRIILETDIIERTAIKTFKEIEYWIVEEESGASNKTVKI